MVPVVQLIGEENEETMKERGNDEINGIFAGGIKRRLVSLPEVLTMFSKMGNNDWGRRRNVHGDSRVQDGRHHAKGNMVDAFISTKLSKRGKRFGFVRFSNVRSEDRMIKCLCEVWFGTYKMFASSPQFKKEDINPLQKKIDLKSSGKIVHNSQVSSSLNSYASIVKGTGVVNGNNEQIQEVIELSSGDFIVERYDRACLVKAIDFLILPNLRMLCLDEGFEDFNMKYVGGLWVLIEFKSMHACENFMSSDVMDHWLLEKRD
ncbi:unnamed protein product [Lactuca saligna]|uniref:RRM domain-containing protein n=1 Tax=Lactuca saligna TaxID=75948 RepID=A0AA36E5Y7_LACSI|nr:unnamed protein product [Lactuca saligna]